MGKALLEADVERLLHCSVTLMWSIYLILRLRKQQGDKNKKLILEMTVYFTDEMLDLIYVPLLILDYGALYFLEYRNGLFIARVCVNTLCYVIVNTINKTRQKFYCPIVTKLFKNTTVVVMSSYLASLVPQTIVSNWIRLVAILSNECVVQKLNKFKGLGWVKAWPNLRSPFQYIYLLFALGIACSHHYLKPLLTVLDFSSVICAPHFDVESISDSDTFDKLTLFKIRTCEVNETGFERFNIFNVAFISCTLIIQIAVQMVSRLSDLREQFPNVGLTLA